MRRTQSSTFTRALLAAALFLALFSCVVHELDPNSRHRWWRSRGPVVPHDSFPADCSLCHEGPDWRTLRADFTFDHERETGVALTGAHVAAECLRCHNDRGPVAVFAARGCAGCHEDPHQAQLGAECAGCHSEDSWRPNEIFALHARGRLPLIGAHAAAACWRCHPGAQAGNFARADSRCEACHGDDLARAIASYAWHATRTEDCETCHRPTGWSGRFFNHASWSLTGQHATLDCSACHVGGDFSAAPRDCFGCHQADYLGAQSPDHVALGLSQQCQNCHDTSNWNNATFDHVGIASGCAQCHQDDYLAANDPDHVAAGFGQVCEQCHTSTSNWRQDNWVHADFPIVGGDHGGLSCTECHQTSSNYTAFSCTHCHDHRQSEMDDEHDRVGGYVWVSSACYQCHPNGKE